MTKTAIKMAIRDTKKELAYCHGMEEIYSPEWRFRSVPYSKRRARLVKTYWALHAMLNSMLTKSSPET